MVPMKKRLTELLVIYVIYFLTLLLYIHLHTGYVSVALGSVVIWLIPLIAVLPTQFLAFIIGVGWPGKADEALDDKTDTRIYRVAHLTVYLLIVILAFK
ncbi:hypothetical protein FHW36_101810 [Chitinophaga polysaccharea]|uniref:Uncharacterized protein n=2 Tax=Chitinophaga polysaccharea TaxID=1293035 RepID=A0A561Q3D3_9BACT|nr:hypothetical protein FHW36_101810 [Chitinophaga polysaccharea]